MSISGTAPARNQGWMMEMKISVAASWNRQLPSSDTLCGLRRDVIERVRRTGI